MIGLHGAAAIRADRVPGSTLRRLLKVAAICSAMFFPLLAVGELDELKSDIQALTDEREALTRELEQEIKRCVESIA